MVFTRPLVASYGTCPSSYTKSKKSSKAANHQFADDSNKENVAPFADSNINGETPSTHSPGSATIGNQTSTTNHHQRIFSTYSSRKSVASVSSANGSNPLQLIVQLQSQEYAEPSRLLCNHYPFSVKQGGEDEKSITVSSTTASSSSFTVKANKVIDCSNMVFCLAEQLEQYSLGSGGVSLFSMSEATETVNEGSPGSGSSPEFRDMVDNTVSMLFDGMGDNRKSAVMSVRPVHWSQVHYEPRLQYNTHAGATNFAPRSSFIDRFAINDNPTPLMATKVDTGLPRKSSNSGSSLSNYSNVGLRLDPSCKHSFWLSIIQLDKFGNYYDVVRGLSVPISGNYQDCEGGREETILKDLKYEFLESAQIATQRIDELLAKCHGNTVGFKKPEVTIVTLHGIRVPKNETESLKNAQILRVNLIDVSPSIFPVLFNTSTKHLQVKKNDTACASLFKLIKEDIKDSSMILSVPRQCKDSSLMVKVLKTLSKNAKGSTKSRNPLSSINLSFKRNTAKKSNGGGLRTSAFDLFDLKFGGSSATTTTATANATDAEDSKYVQTPLPIRDGKGPFLNTEIPSLDCDFLEEIHRELESLGAGSGGSGMESSCSTEYTSNSSKNIPKSKVSSVVGGVLVMPATPVRKNGKQQNGGTFGRKFGSSKQTITKTTTLTTSVENCSSSSVVSLSPPSAIVSVGKGRKGVQESRSIEKVAFGSAMGVTTDEEEFYSSSLASQPSHRNTKERSGGYLGESPSSINLSPASDLSRTKSEYQMQELSSQYYVQKGLLAERESQLETLSGQVKYLTSELGQEKNLNLRLQDKIKSLTAKLEKEFKSRSDEIRIQAQETRDSMEKELAKRTEEFKRSANREIHDLRKRVEEEIQNGILIKMDYEVALQSAQGETERLSFIKTDLERKIEDLENQLDMAVMQSNGQKPPASLLKHRSEAVNRDFEGHYRPTSDIFQLENTKSRLPAAAAATPTITDRLKSLADKIIHPRKNGFLKRLFANPNKTSHEEMLTRRRHSDLPPKIPAHKYRQYLGEYQDKDARSKNNTHTRVKGPIMPTKTGGISVVFTDIKQKKEPWREDSTINQVKQQVAEDSFRRDREMDLDELVATTTQKQKYGINDDDDDDDDYDWNLTHKPPKHMNCSEYLMARDGDRKRNKNDPRANVMNVFEGETVDSQPARQQAIETNNFNSFATVDKESPFRLGLFKKSRDNRPDNCGFSADVSSFNVDEAATGKHVVHKPIYLTNNARTLLEEIINGNEDLDSQSVAAKVQFRETAADSNTKPNNGDDISARKQRILDQMKNIDFGSVMEGNYFSL